MLPSTECAATSRRMLPRVWLNSHVYQNVTAIVVSRPPTSIGVCNPPSSRKKRGRCQPATSTARIEVDAKGERVACSPGRATPFQPGCSPRGPSVGLTRRTANTVRKVVREVNVSDGRPDPAAKLSPTIARCTASGSPIATAYQYHLTRQRIIRKPSTLSPATPWLIGITMRTATSGAYAPKVPNGNVTHAIT